MKRFRVEVTDKAEEMLEHCLEYLAIDLMNWQAYEALKQDYEDTLVILGKMAGSLPVCENQELTKRNLRKISFQRHRYLLLYQVDGDVATVVAVYHQLEDYGNKIK